MKYNDIDWPAVQRDPAIPAGRHSMIFTDPILIKEWIGYDLPKGCCVKVFRHEDWQGTPFDTAAVIQNIFWIHGFAPRVLEIRSTIEDGKTFWWFVIEYIEGSNETGDIGRLYSIASIHHIDLYNGGHDEVKMTKDNWRGGKYLDFGGAYFEDEELYKKELIERIKKTTHFGKLYKGEIASYQSIEGWGIDGKRKTEYRVQQMGLHGIDFKGKTVLDIGCNLGMMMHYARTRGASEICGYDTLPNVLVAREFANYNKIFDLHFQSSDLSKRVPDHKADIVFFLAMSMYVGFPSWIREVTNEVLIYEGHGHEDAEETRKKLGQHFSSVESIGATEDRDVRPLFICRV